MPGGRVSDGGSDVMSWTNGLTVQPAETAKGRAPGAEDDEPGLDTAVGGIAAGIGRCCLGLLDV